MFYVAQIFLLNKINFKQLQVNKLWGVFPNIYCIKGVTCNILKSVAVLDCEAEHRKRPFHML